MIDKIINSIIDAENEARNIEKRAKEKANKILIDAEEESIQIVKEDIKNIKKEKREVEAQASKKIDKLRKDTLSITEKTSVGLKTSVFSKYEKAIDLVVERYVERNVSR